MFFYVLATCLLGSLAINVHVFPGKDYCFTIKGGEPYHVEYVVSGANETNTVFQVIHNLETIAKVENQSEHIKTYDFNQTTLDLCWSVTDGVPKVVSFQFFPSRDPLKSLITKHHIAIVEGAITEAFEGLGEVHRNQIYQMERDQVHRNILEETDSKITMTGVIKILVMIGSAALQLWIMRGFFKNSGASYSEVSMTG